MKHNQITMKHSDLETKAQQMAAEHAEVKKT